MDMQQLVSEFLSSDHGAQATQALTDQKLVLELADALTATPAQVTEELRERLRRRFTTPQLVELGGAIAWENYRARSNRVFGFGSEYANYPAIQSGDQVEVDVQGATFSGPLT